MGERTVTTATVLPLSAAGVRDLLTRTATLRYVCWPLLTFPDDLPAELGAGTDVELGIGVLGVGPLWRHRVRVVDVDDGGAVTEERGGPVRRWRHRLTVEPVDAGHALYRDEVRFDAGPLTPAVVPAVRALYRWRHRRWRRMVAALSS